MTSLLLAVIYLAFIGLGLPDSLLGAAWPMIYPQFGVPVSSMGLISMIISAGTILSSLNSSRLTRALGAGKVTLLSTALTAIALLGFGMSRSLWQLCFWAVPYGLGAGSVDAALNNYVALHYASRHMSWLHCMWGVGTIIGPSLMSAALTGGHGWSGGYLLTALVQGLIVAVLLLSLPLWGRPTSGNGSETETAALSLREVLAIPGAKEVMLCFFGYCALESTAGLWAASYLTLARDIPAETAAGFAALFYLGITAGRAVSGWIAPHLGDDGMIRLGLWGIGLGLAALLLPGPAAVSLAGLVIIGLGCAPIYPSIIHSTPAHFGAHRSQAVIGVQMASAYVGSMAMPPLFGLMARQITPALFPFYLLVLLGLMAWMHHRLVHKATPFTHSDPI
mgnify:FL=1